MLGARPTLSCLSDREDGGARGGGEPGGRGLTVTDHSSRGLESTLWAP